MLVSGAPTAVGTLQEGFPNVKLFETVDSVVSESEAPELRDALEENEQLHQQIRNLTKLLQDTSTRREQLNEQII
jgi:hypothetical protein